MALPDFRALEERVCDRLVDAGLFSAVPHLVPTVVGFTLGEARATVCRLLLD